ncbi:hypothetical protein [Flavobacterium sp.]|uniref:hypothetical protein n=1 Tax=Flavobacterium sp. TaxID=239 RepID=UPI0024881CCB|nr:hypothetical protein [Flavobacterium sp.]MDI1317908.1 hypothetical protein [Flavobacterium sp.]
MKNLKHNSTYQILKLRLELIKSQEREHFNIIKFGYGEEANKFRLIRKDINNKLVAKEQDLKKQYDSLELTSENLGELERISTILLEFKDFDESLLFTVKNKIDKLIEIKENATKKYDFKTANNAREEIHLLQKYLNQHKL